jgi:hypothetical protein
MLYIKINRIPLHPGKRTPIENLSSNKKGTRQILMLSTGDLSVLSVGIEERSYQERGLSFCCASPQQSSQVGPSILLNLLLVVDFWRKHPKSRTSKP